MSNTISLDTLINNFFLMKNTHKQTSKIMTNSKKNAVKIFLPVEKQINKNIYIFDTLNYPTFSHRFWSCEIRWAVYSLGVRQKVNPTFNILDSENMWKGKEF